MSATSVDAGETVSRPCLRGESSPFLSTPSLPRQALFPWPYVEGLNEARTMLADFFSIRQAGNALSKISMFYWDD